MESNPPGFVDIVILTFVHPIFVGPVGLVMVLVMVVVVVVMVLVVVCVPALRRGRGPAMSRLS